MRAIGLMSGMSLDGIDIAMVETDGETVTRFGPSATDFYGPAEKDVLRRAVEAGRDLNDRTARPGVLGEAERMVTELHAAAVETFLAVNGIDRAGVDVVGFHGQTVLHHPESRLTVRIGNGAGLATTAPRCARLCGDGPDARPAALGLYGTHHGRRARGRSAAGLCAQPRAPPIRRSDRR